MADDLTYWARKEIILESHEERPAEIKVFFDGGVDSVGKSKQEYRFPVRA